MELDYETLSRRPGETSAIPFFDFLNRKRHSTGATVMRTYASRRRARRCSCHRRRVAIAAQIDNNCRLTLPRTAFFCCCKRVIRSTCSHRVGVISLSHSTRIFHLLYSAHVLVTNLRLEMRTRPVHRGRSLRDIT